MLGTRIKEIRESTVIAGKKMSQKKLSELIGSEHHTTIGRIERGEINLSIITLKKIAKALNIPIYELLKS